MGNWIWVLSPETGPHAVLVRQDESILPKDDPKPIELSERLREQLRFIVYEPISIESINNDPNSKIKIV